MKRKDLLAHLLRHGCRFVREGADHSIWENPAHREIPEFTASRICKQLGIPPA